MIIPAVITARNTKMFVRKKAQKFPYSSLESQFLDLTYIRMCIWSFDVL